MKRSFLKKEGSGFTKITVKIEIMISRHSVYFLMNFVVLISKAQSLFIEEKLRGDHILLENRSVLNLLFVKTCGLLCQLGDAMIG